MVVLGLLFVVIAVGAGTAVVLGTSAQDETITLSGLGTTVSMQPLTLFLSGVAAAILLWLGWILVRAGTRRSVRQRREAKENARLAAEKQAELREREASRTAGGPGSTAASRDAVGTGDPAGRSREEVAPEEHRSDVPRRHTDEPG